MTGMDEYKDIPGGKLSVGCGVLLAIVMMTVASLNLFAGLMVLAMVGLLLNFTMRGIIGDRSLVTVFSTALALLPVMLFAYFILLAMISFICCLILLFL